MTESDNNPEVRAQDENSVLQHPLLSLNLPRQLVPKADNFLLDPKETDLWFATLPMANIGETARRVFSALVDFNRTDIPDLLRSKSVEKFRPAVEYISNNLQKYYVDIGMPLSSKGWKTASLTGEMFKELAISYKIIISRMIGGETPNFDRRLLVTALHRALYYLGQSLLQSALVYTEWPKGIWREINGIYAYASQNQIHQLVVRSDAGADPSQQSTIEEQFKSLLLFASATPHRLRQSHAKLLYGRLIEWSRHASIQPVKADGNDVGRFNVDLWTDSPPVHNALRSPTPANRGAVIDLNGLLKRLHDDLEHAPWEVRNTHSTEPTPFSRTLLRLLIMAWSRPPDRRYIRTRLNFELRVVAGLHAVYANLRSGGQRPYQTTSAAVFSLEASDEPPRKPGRERTLWSPGSLENASLAPLDSELVGDRLMRDSYLAGSRGPVLPDVMENFATPQPPEKDDLDPHTVSTINESAGGYCIRWKGEQIPRVKIGELIGVESAGDMLGYGLGVIRWMKQESPEVIDLGLEVISTRCEAADVRLAETKGPIRPKPPVYKALIINDTDPAGHATASLILSNMTFATGIDLVLSMGTGEQRIRLTKVVEFSNAFARYHFEFIRSEQDSSDLDSRPGDEFNDLWSNL